MIKFYSHPYKLYLVFLFLALAGYISYIKMPVALFPNSTKPEIYLNIAYDQTNQEGFIDIYGKSLEARLNKINIKKCKIDNIKALYGSDHAVYKIIFSWGDDGQVCLKEVNNEIVSYRSEWSRYVNENTYAYLDHSGSGFLFGNFYSSSKSSEEIYSYLEGVILPKLESIESVSQLSLYNPNNTQVTITISPEILASLKVSPTKLFETIKQEISSVNAGLLNQSGSEIAVEFSGNASNLEDLNNIMIPTNNNDLIPLSKIAKISLMNKSKNQQIFQIDGKSSVILYATPKTGFNIKDMSNQISDIIDEAFENGKIPEEINFLMNINPAEFIEKAINNVMHEVLLCSLIAVIILFFFIGSISATATAVIEIPISIILSFILLKLTNVEINLVSLGGLALSVGMNIDASIVVIDSIIKSLNNLKPGASYNEAYEKIVSSVREVATPLILSTLTSLVVFLPLSFTSDLTYAILGDLAIAVIYSHGISLFIALILVPTVRLHMLKQYGISKQMHFSPFLSRFLNNIYEAYCKSLIFFIQHRFLQIVTITSIVLSLVFSIIYILPRLNTEIIGVPETSIMGVNINMPSSIYHEQLKRVVEDFSELIKKEFPKDIGSIFSNIYSANTVFIAVHLNDKKRYKEISSKLEELTKGRMDIFYSFFPFNPSELKIPNPSDWKIEFVGQNISELKEVIQYFYYELKEDEILHNIDCDLDSIGKRKLQYKFIPKAQLKQNSTINYNDISTMISLANNEQKIGKIFVDDKKKEVLVLFPDSMSHDFFKLINMPIAVNDYIIPLRSLIDIIEIEPKSTIIRTNNENKFSLSGKFIESEKPNSRKTSAKLREKVKDFQNNILPSISKSVSIQMVDSKFELTKALKEVIISIAISLLLILLILYSRFSNFKHTLIIMLAIPFGFLGVILSLYIFNSSISLNSAIGVILLNGIAVANSILLVEMILKSIKSGLLAIEAIKIAAQKRIRPILMTSLTTLFGMFPIAVGYGEGGAVLQPLGIAVCGGLWVSLICTLYIIPLCIYKIYCKDEVI